MIVQGLNFIVTKAFFDRLLPQKSTLESIGGLSLGLISLLLFTTFRLALEGHLLVEGILKHVFAVPAHKDAREQDNRPAKATHISQQLEESVCLTLIRPFLV